MNKPTLEGDFAKRVVEAYEKGNEPISYAHQSVVALAYAYQESSRLESCLKRLVKEMRSARNGGREVSLMVLEDLWEELDRE